jgi:hypothetical protein
MQGYYRDYRSSLIWFSSPNLTDSNLHAHPHAPALYLARTNPLSNSGIMGPPPRPGLRTSASLPAVKQIPSFQCLILCRGCLWRQVDIKEAQICGDYKEEKLAIISQKHVKFSPLYQNRGMYLDEARRAFGLLP